MNVLILLLLQILHRFVLVVQRPVCAEYLRRVELQREGMFPAKHGQTVSSVRMTNLTEYGGKYRHRRMSSTCGGRDSHRSGARHRGREAGVPTLSCALRIVRSYRGRITARTTSGQRTSVPPSSHASPRLRMLVAPLRQV